MARIIVPTPLTEGMTLISETVASANSSINFTSIPGTYKQLMLVWTGLYPSNTSQTFALRFNNDSTADIYATVLSVNTGIAGGTFTNADGDPNNGFNLLGYQSSSSSTAIQEQINGFLVIDNYASASKFKSYRGFGSWRANASVYRDPQVTGVYKSTSAITSLDIVNYAGSGTLTNATSTSIRLYGIS
jgi:hypothetical protein